MNSIQLSKSILFIIMIIKNKKLTKNNKIIKTFDKETFLDNL